MDIIEGRLKNRLKNSNYWCQMSELRGKSQIFLQIDQLKARLLMRCSVPAIALFDYAERSTSLFICFENAKITDVFQHSWKQLGISCPGFRLSLSSALSPDGLPRSDVGVMLSFSMLIIILILKKSFISVWMLCYYRRPVSPGASDSKDVFFSDASRNASSHRK